MDERRNNGELNHLQLPFIAKSLGRFDRHQQALKSPCDLGFEVSEMQRIAKVDFTDCAMCLSRARKHLPFNEELLNAISGATLFSAHILPIKEDWANAKRFGREGLLAEDRLRKKTNSEV